MRCNNYVILTITFSLSLSLSLFSTAVFRFDICTYTTKWCSKCIRFIEFGEMSNAMILVRALIVCVSLTCTTCKYNMYYMWEHNHRRFGQWMRKTTHLCRVNRAFAEMLFNYFKLYMNNLKSNRSNSKKWSKNKTNNNIMKNMKH